MKRFEKGWNGFRWPFKYGEIIPVPPCSAVVVVLTYSAKPLQDATKRKKPSLRPSNVVSQINDMELLHQRVSPAMDEDWTSSSSSLSSSPVDTISIPRRHHGKVNFKSRRPVAAIDTSVLDEIEEPNVPPTPRHAAQQGASGNYFFPSPRSVLERRSSTGSFF